jgi:hypothetical protein
MKKITLLEERKKLYNEINEVKKYNFHSDLTAIEKELIIIAAFTSCVIILELLSGGHKLLQILSVVLIFLICAFGISTGLADLTYHIKLKVKFNRKEDRRKDIRMFLPHLYTLLFFAFLYFVEPLSSFDTLKNYHFELFFVGFISFYVFNYRKIIYSFISKEMKNKKNEESLRNKMKAIDKEILKNPDLCVYILENEYDRPSCKDIFDNLDPKTYLISHFKTKTTKKENEIETL